MKKKIITSTYLNEAIKHEIKLFLDEDEFINAYKEGDISLEDYNLVLKIKDKLINEIKTGNNKLMNLDYTKYLKDF